MGETRIIAIGANGAENAADEAAHVQPVETSEAVAEETAYEREWVEADEEPHAPRRDWVVPAVAGIAAACWTGFFLWANQSTFAGGIQPAAWPALVGQWVIPMLLIGLGWLLAMRLSTREARRFGDAAQLLSAESSRLEERLDTVNRELSLAREFIASQSRDLEALGRIAAERLSQNAQKLQDLIRDNGARVDSIGTVSKAALENMEKLRGQLPVIASSAKDVTNNIGNAGRAAHGQLEDMIAGFNRLNEFGVASERQVSTLRDRIESALDELRQQGEQLDRQIGERFDALAQNSADLRARLDGNEVDALASIRTRAAALEQEIATTRSQLDDHEAESLTSLRSRLAALRDESGVVSRMLRDGETRAIEDWKQSLGAIEEDHGRIDTLIATSRDNAVGRLREGMDGLERDIGQIDSRLADLARAASEQLAQRRVLSEQAETEARDRLVGQLVELDAAMASRLSGHESQAAALADRAADVLAKLDGYQSRFEAIAGEAHKTQDEVARNLSDLTERLTAARATMASTEGDLAALTTTSVRLLELIQASAKQTHKDLPEAMAMSEDRLSRLNAGLSDLVERLRQGSENGQALGLGIDATGSKLDTIIAGLTRAQDDLANQGRAHAEALSAIRKQLAELDTMSEAASGRAEGELRKSLETLGAAIDEAMGRIEKEAPERINEFSSRLADDSSEAIGRAMRNKVSEVSGQIEQSVSHASGLAREATIQLRDQLAKVNELVGNLENRVSHARAKAEEQVDNDFSRRVALITESLNSNAIDIARVLSADVADTAWAAYLRGDRGIFTRRAVSLLESGEVKAVQQAFENDDAFREHVSRYIHDFEAMLRQILSTRDGNALGVALLSSDMGKLYVALAQGIERLRA